MPASAARRQRYLEQKAREAAAANPPQRPLTPVADPAAEPPAPPAPAAPAAREEEVDFTLPPGGSVPGARTAPLKKTLIVPSALNGHLLWFQSRHQGQEHKVQNGTLALWRVLLREEHEMVAEARRLSEQTGRPAEPRQGPVLRRYLAELERMADESDR